MQIGSDNTVAASYYGTGFLTAPLTSSRSKVQPSLPFQPITQKRSVAKSAKTFGPKECQTCKNRRYKDQSNDPTVSFQSGTTIPPAVADAAVRAHEEEHVRHEQARAAEQKLKVVSQTVTISYGICPECGRVYVSGGETETVTVPIDSQGKGGGTPQLGLLLDTKA